MTDEVRQEDRDLYRELLTIAEHNRIRRACDEPIVDPLLLIARHASPLRTRIAELEGALAPFARVDVLEPNGVVVGLERLHFERARATLNGGEERWMSAIASSSTGFR